MALTLRLNGKKHRHSGRNKVETRNPEKRPPLVVVDPGLRRDDGGYNLKYVPFNSDPNFIYFSFTGSVPLIYRILSVNPAN